MTIQEALARLLDGHDLSQAEAREVMNHIMAGEATPAQLAAFVVLLRAKGETTDELAGLVDTMQARAVAVAVDGRSVYVQTMRVVGPNRFDARLGVGQPESAYGVAVYDVARGAFVREVPLGPPWCGVAELYPLPDGRLAVFCGLAHEVRLVDPVRGAQVGSVGVDGIASVVGPDGRRLWAVDRVGGVHEVDLGRMAVVREAQIGSDRGEPSVPGQELHATADGTRLFVRAAPGDAELRATGNGSEVWVVDTATLRRLAVVPLPAPEPEASPLEPEEPDGAPASPEPDDAGGCGGGCGAAGGWYSNAPSSLVAVPSPLPSTTRT
jgi:hypothetical protein